MPYNLAGGRIEKSLKAKFQALNDRLSKLVGGDASSDARDLQVRCAAGFAARHLRRHPFDLNTIMLFFGTARKRRA